MMSNQLKGQKQIFVWACSQCERGKLITSTSYEGEKKKQSSWVNCCCSLFTIFLCHSWKHGCLWVRVQVCLFLLSPFLAVTAPALRTRRRADNLNCLDCCFRLWHRKGRRHLFNTNSSSVRHKEPAGLFCSPLAYILYWPKGNIS